MENSDPAAPQLPTPGERLREAREAAGISPREMADRLNWLPSHIQAVEEDRFDVLRGAAFVRGYLRAYARALDLDEDDMVALYAAMEPDQAQVLEDSDSATSPAAPGQNAGLWLVALVAFAVVVIAVISWVREPEAPDTTASAAAPAETQTAEPALAAADSSAEPEPASVSLADTPPEVTREDSTVSLEAEPPAQAPAEAVQVPAEEVQAPADEVQLPAEQSVAAAAPVDAGPEGAILEFSFSGDCWLEVRDGDGQLIYADLRGAGDTLRLDGTPPFEILAGDAAAVTLTYLGEPVPVRTRPGRDTARFTVGEP